MKKKPCDDCIIGVLDMGGNPKLATMPILLKHIDRQRELHDLYTSHKAEVLFNGMDSKPIKVYTIKDYCGGSVHTDLFRFSCCPKCGYPIEWNILFDKYKHECYNGED